MNAFNTHSGQVEFQALPASRVLGLLRVGYSETDRVVSGLRRNAVDAYLKHGYRLRGLEAYGSAGDSTAYSSDARERNATLLWGAGVRWSPRPAATVELEWQSTDRRDQINPMFNSLERRFEMRMNSGL